MRHVVARQLSEHIFRDLEHNHLTGLSGLASATLLGLDTQYRVQDGFGRVNLDNGKDNGTNEQKGKAKRASTERNERTNQGRKDKREVIPSGSNGHRLMAKTKCSWDKKFGSNLLTTFSSLPTSNQSTCTSSMLVCVTSGLFYRCHWNSRLVGLILS